MIRRGITLIELLVALIVAGIVAFLAFELVLGEHAHYTRTRNKVRLQSDGREAIRVLEEDLLNVGYRSGLNVVGTTVPYPAELTICNALAGDERVVVKDGGQNMSDTLTIRYFEADSKVGVKCASTPNIVSYYVQSDSSLARDFTKAGDPAGTLPTTSIILKGAVTLQFQVGVDTATDPVQSLRTTDTLWMHGEKGGWNTSPLTSKSEPVSGSALDTQRTFSGWISGTEGVVTTSSAKTLEPNSTYELSALLKVNPDFQAMFDTTTPAQHYIRFLVVSGTTTVDSTSIHLPPTNAPTWVSWRFQTGMGNVFNSQLELKAKISSVTPTPSPTLAISNLKVTRVRNAGEVNGMSPYTWQDASTDPTVATAQRRRTLAVHAWLLARSANANKEMAQSSFDNIGNWKPYTPLDQNSYALYERIIPVGNYGY